MPPNSRWRRAAVAATGFPAPRQHISGLLGSVFSSRGYIRCSGSGIRCLFDPWIRDGKKIKIRIRDEHPGSYFQELKTIFWVKNTLILLCESNPGSGIFLTLDPGSGMEKFESGIINPDPQHCLYLGLFSAQGCGFEVTFS